MQKHNKTGDIMIKEIHGDILLSDAQCWAHGVAANDDFKKDLAQHLKESYPSLYKDFRHFCQNQHPKAGTIWTWASADGKRIVQLLTQEGHYEKGARPGEATIHNVHHALKKLKEFVIQEKITSVAIPRIGTGTGGLKWDDVYPLVKEELSLLNIPIYVYTKYERGVKGF